MIRDDCNDCRSTVAGCPAHRDPPSATAGDVIRAIIAEMEDDEEQAEDEPEED